MANDRKRIILINFKTAQLIKKPIQGRRSKSVRGRCQSQNSGRTSFPASSASISLFSMPVACSRGSAITAKNQNENHRRKEGESADLAAWCAADRFTAAFCKRPRAEYPGLQRPVFRIGRGRGVCCGETHFCWRIAPSK
jgi:hypothetical protein